MKIILLCSLYVFSFLSIYEKLSLKVLAKEATCNAIAKVISSSNPNYRFGTTICFGSVLKISQQFPLEIACINSIHSFKAVSSNDLYACPVTKYIEKPKIPDAFQSVVRGSGDQPVVIRPYGVNQIVPNPDLQWSPNKKANSYRVVVDDWDKYWFSVNSNVPSAKLPALKPGTYQVLISALNHDDIIGETTITIVILSSIQVHEVTKLISSIDLLNDSNSQKIVYKLGVLSRFNLLEESIAYLSRYLSSNRSNMLLTRTLGDLYLDASQPQQARQAYISYQEIAHKNASREDIESAEERIQLLASFEGSSSH